MAIGIIGWDANGQPMYGDIGDPGKPGYSGNAPAPGTPAPRAVTTSSIDPSTGQPRPVLPPAYDPQPQLQSNLYDWQHDQDFQDNTYVSSVFDNQTKRDSDEAGWETSVGGDLAKLPGVYQQVSDARTGNTAGLRDAYSGYNASDLAATNNFVGTNNANLGIYNQRTNDLYNTPAMQIQAAQWSSNPQDIANQNQALGNFSDIYGGSLDYQAAQAQAQMAQLYQYASDPSDVKRQQEAIEQLKGMINGGEWNDSLRDVRDKYKALTDPQITAQERYIMENFNQRREDLDRSKREAVMSNLGARGLRSGAAEQTGMLQSQQEMGRQEVLAGLGAEANAVGRSQQALAGYANTSAAGRNSQLQAMGMYVDAAGNLRQMDDQVGEFNTHEANTNSMFNAGQQNEVNMFNTGQTNNARANNQATRLSGAQGFADESNAIRQSNDYVGTFNTGQQNIVGMHNQDAYNQDLDRKAVLAQSQLVTNTATGQVGLDAIKSTNKGNADRDTVIHDDQQADINSWGAGLIAPITADIGFQGDKLTNRGTVTNGADLTASTRYGVFTPTIAGKKLNKDQLAAGRNLTYG